MSEKRDLQKVLADLKQLQERGRDSELSAEEKTQWGSLVVEAKRMQDAADRDNMVREMEQAEAKSRRVADVILPAEERKGRDEQRGRVYASLGDAFVTSDEYKSFMESGMPTSGSRRMQTEDMIRRKGRNFVPLSQERGAQIKAIPTLGSGVVDEDRLNEIVWQTEYDELNLLSVIPTSSTDSNAVEWIRKTTYTRAATTVADVLASGVATKPETTSAYTIVNTPVRTMAVWHPVTKQQVADFRQLRGLIDGDLLYDLGKLTEEQILYGDDTGTNFDGIFPTVQEARLVSGDTLIDRVRRAMTDVRTDGHRPSHAVMHPLDWETILLTKDEESRYIWVVVTGENGMRLWALPVIENESCLNTETDERNILVADMRRLATLWMRETPNVAVGWITDQFIRNQYTILAEQRAAFAVQRPLAGRRIETVAASS